MRQSGWRSVYTLQIFLSMRSEEPAYPQMMTQHGGELFFGSCTSTAVPDTAQARSKSMLQLNTASGVSPLSSYTELSSLHISAFWRTGSLSAATASVLSAALLLASMLTVTVEAHLAPGGMRYLYLMRCHS